MSSTLRSARIFGVMCLACSGLNSFELAAQTGDAVNSTPGASTKCPPGPGGQRPTTDAREATAEERAKLLERVAKSTYGARMAQQISVPLKKAIADRNDRTSMSYSKEHGTQVSFTSGDGRVFLWYPGNPIVLAGAWLACEERMSSSSPETGPIAFTYGTVCTKFGENTFNPVTKSVGAVWECGAAGTRDVTLIERRNGDVFGLAKRQSAPFVLAKDQTSMADLQKKVPRGKAN